MIRHAFPIPEASSWTPGHQVRYGQRAFPRPYANFELRRGGVLAVSKGLAIKDRSTRLLLERRGDEVRASFGHDGVRWTSFLPLTVDLDESLSVGIVAINSAAKPLRAELEMFAITRRPRPGDVGREEKHEPGRPESRPSP